MSESMFDADAIGGLAGDLGREIARVYSAAVPMPVAGERLPPIPAKGLSMAGLPDLWRLIVDQSAHLATPWMSGHMDTAPHPAAALTQGLIAALNNNLLFRELSPMASAVEEQLMEFFAARLELGEGWHGVFTSGGSLANLTALFAAVGGFSPEVDRNTFHLFLPASAHLSLSKSASVLGLTGPHVLRVACDDAGRMIPEALEQGLLGLPAGARPIVVSVLGTTIHGSVDDVPAIAGLCEAHGAWHHVDAIYGTALGLSRRYRRFLEGLPRADSISLGPQKWMYVPRLSALCMIKGKARFDDRLAAAVPYSIGHASHRGAWGLQGSRPADAIVLWATLQVLGTEVLADTIDGSISLTRAFHEVLAASATLKPTHRPDLNLQTFRVGASDADGARLGRVQARLAAGGRTWMSVSRWRDEALMRAVLLSPSLTTDHIHGFVSDIERAAA
jgi:glutamate/tyrosine decarboxylase-like PLP-dependent enzyme